MCFLRVMQIRKQAACLRLVASLADAFSLRVTVARSPPLAPHALTPLHRAPHHCLHFRRSPSCTRHSVPSKGLPCLILAVTPLEVRVWMRACTQLATLSHSLLYLTLFRVRCESESCLRAEGDPVDRSPASLRNVLSFFLLTQPFRLGKAI